METFQQHKDGLVPAFERHRPSPTVYSPLALFFNFSHNVLKGIVVDALLWGEPRTVTLNDLFTAIRRGKRGEDAKEILAKTLMGYARAHGSNPRPADAGDRLRSRRGSPSVRADDAQDRG